MISSISPRKDIAPLHMKLASRWLRYIMNKCATYSAVTVSKRDILKIVFFSDLISGKYVFSKSFSIEVV